MVFITTVVTDSHGSGSACRDWSRRRRRRGRGPVAAAGVVGRTTKAGIVEIPAFRLSG